MRVALAVCFSVVVAGCSSPSLVAVDTEQAAIKGGNSCQIDKGKFERGQVNPANACQVCDPGRDNKAWSNVADGTGCDDGDACTPADSCRAGACLGGANECGGSAVIGAAGGIVTTPSGLTVQFPRSAIDSDTTITVTESGNAPPPGHGAVTPVFDFGPSGTVFAHPVTVSFPLPANAPSNLVVFWTKQDGSGVFESIGGRRVGSTISADVTHFSSAFVGEDPGMRTINGTRYTTWVSGDNIQNVVRGTPVVEALVFDGATFTHYPGSWIPATSTFTIPDVPDGVVYVRVGGIYTLTAGSLLDLTNVRIGRMDEVAADSSSSMSFTADNMIPWQLGDTFEVDCAEVNTWGAFFDASVTNPPSLGAQAISNLTVPDTLDALSDGSGQVPANLVEGSKGDHCILAHLQLQQTTDAVPVFYFTRVDEFDAPLFDQTDGVTTAVPPGHFTPISTQATVAIDLKGTDYASLIGASGAVPNSDTHVAFYIDATPPAADHVGFGARLLFYDQTGVVDIFASNLGYGLPTSGPWEASLNAGAYRTVLITAPGATTGQVEYEQVQVMLEASILSSTATTVAPGLGQALHPKINGNDLFQPQSGVGQSPTLTWTAPSVGTPDLYQITVYEVDEDNGGTDVGTVAIFATAGTTLTIPPGILFSGVSYVFGITSQKNLTPGAPADATTVPVRLPRDFHNANMFTAVVTP